ncbi:hypothetical protein OPKNFCMD_0606 [Methylobacterium crusticola]|uniref:DUF4347 domain-containing protein n=1 Tax=Methylobacterium crusticola TaxID=1697972 RepID=A0ABQ4QRN4_9HYPH|nr:hypothetical protein [Methylobacterium crusticola]GJD47894.1 hypothetical protein OPKNFCMD_0606 [Methylobacterium crusticola]
MGAGTLLVYDEAFPRAKTQTGAAIRNSPSEAELRDNKYPEPYKLLPIKEAAAPDAYFADIAKAAKDMGQLGRLIILGHGRVVPVANEAGNARIFMGVIMGATPISISNASGLGKLRGLFAKGASAELWVCEAASRETEGGISGVVFCQKVADTLGVVVVAAEITQIFESADQQPTPEGGWQSTAKFLPWDGTPQRFSPRPQGK